MTHDTTDRHVIIGAGFSGLGVAAAFKRRSIPFDVLEADVEVGGNWFHGVYETVHIISSRKTTEYRDFPMPASYPDFPSKDQMLAYLISYAEHHGLYDHIRFHAKVVRVSEAKTPGRWLVEVEGEEPREYAGVVVCNGHHWDPRMPVYPGAFEGKVLHSKAYRDHSVLDDRRVLVVGGGNSACDIAAEAARFGRSAHISLRRGYWFLPKTVFGVPSIELMKPWMPIPFQRTLLRGVVRVMVGRYEDYGLPRPDHRIFEKHPTINSELLHHIKHGRVTPRPDIARFEGRDVVFVDGTRETFDVIVYATGYKVSFPFLDPGIIDFVNGVPQLIGNVVPRNRKNLYVFGLGQPRYGAGPLITAGADLLCTMVETQSRLESPLGMILSRMGQKVPKTYLVDPHRVLRQVKMGQRLMPQLPRVERWIGRRQPETVAAR